MTEPARPAATVVLLRDVAEGAGPGIEAWLLRRVRALAFAGGATVFPGGRVDPADHLADVPWAGAEPAAVAARFGCSVDDARASTVAAIRETFEETGVLLTRPPHAIASDPDARWLAERRREVEGRELSFAALLAGLNAAIDADLIRPWARWITPVGEPRRYDTHFYVARLPAGARADAETTEATEAQWLRPADAVAEYEAGRRPMLAPTVLTLTELAGFETVADVLTAADQRSLAPVAPELVTTADGRRLARLPDGRHFPLRP